MTGEITASFLKRFRGELRGKMLVEPGASYYYPAKFHPPRPHTSSLTYDREVRCDVVAKGTRTAARILEPSEHFRVLE